MLPLRKMKGTIMANKTLFKTVSVSKHPATDTVNAAGGRAYSLPAKEALTQYVVTGCFGNTYYATAEEQLDKIKELVDQVDSETIAKLAVYGRTKAYMKDTPSYLLAVLFARRENELVAKIFSRVVDNAKMLCNFVQIVRSGVTGRRSFGEFGKRLIQNWLLSRTGDELFNDSVGQGNPSLADIIKMVHPKANTKVSNSMFAYLLNKDYDYENLPRNVKAFERFKKNNENELPDVPFRVLTNCNLTLDHWIKIARDMPWNTLRMNLNMLQRNGVFCNDSVTRELVDKLRNEEIIRKVKVFPYQLMTAYLNTQDVPTSVKNALQDALEVSTQNVPSFNNKVAVCVDTSGSMGSAITGNRGTTTSKTTCVDVAGLIASCIVRKNDESVVIPFDTRVHLVDFNSRDSVLTNARKFARHGGGTSLSCAMAHLNDTNWKGNLVIFVSDNESWADYSGYRYGRDTGLNVEWQKFKRNNPKAKLVLIDLVPNSTVQTKNDKDVLNVGGFSDSVFDVISKFVSGDTKSFMNVIDSIEL